MPKMGESVAEATIISWNKNIGDKIEIDETIIEIATDKVDSEVPSEYSGILVEKLFKENDIVKVGQPFAIIETNDGVSSKETIIEENNNEATDETTTKEEKKEITPETSSLKKDENRKTLNKMIMVL